MKMKKEAQFLILKWILSRNKERLKISFSFEQCRKRCYKTCMDRTHKYFIWKETNCPSRMQLNILMIHVLLNKFMRNYIDKK